MQKFGSAKYGTEIQELREITIGQQKVKQHISKSQEKKNGRRKLNYTINGSQIGISPTK